jgi:hypothetical protein
MGRQKPSKPSKLPNKQIEEQYKQPNNDPSTNIIPQSATARKKNTDTIEQSENPQTKPYRAHTPSRTFTQAMNQCCTIWIRLTAKEN